MDAPAPGYVYPRRDLAARLRRRGRTDDQPRPGQARHPPRGSRVGWHAAPADRLRRSLGQSEEIEFLRSGISSLPSATATPTSTAGRTERSRHRSRAGVVRAQSWRLLCRADGLGLRRQKGLVYSPASRSRRSSASSTASADGSGMTRVTREDGVHRPASARIGASISTPTEPRRAAVTFAHAAADGALRTVSLRRAPPSPRSGFRLRAAHRPGIRRLPAAGTDPKPRGFSATERHPVILRSTAAPACRRCGTTGSRRTLRSASRDRGYVVASIDNAATAASKTIENASLKNLWEKAP